MEIKKLFTGTYCASAKINGYAIAGYGKSFSEAIDEVFSQIRYLVKLELI